MTSASTFTTTTTTMTTTSGVNHPRVASFGKALKRNARPVGATGARVDAISARESALTRAGTGRIGRETAFTREGKRRAEREKGITRRAIAFPPRVIPFITPVIRLVSRVIRFPARVIRFSGPPIRFPTRVIRFSTRVIRFSGPPIRFSPPPIRFSTRAFRFSGLHHRFMRYLMSDLEARSGLTARTIRDYIRHGYLAPPEGHGLAASYDEEQLLRVVAIARMRTAKEGWNVIAERMKTWSLGKVRAFVQKTEPQPGAPPTEAAAPSSVVAPPEIEAEPVPPGAPRHPEADTTTELQRKSAANPGDLPEGQHFVMAPVLPGLVLLLRHDAAPLVKRTAAEILEKYAALH